MHDADPDFVYAISLLAAMEGATSRKRHSVLLPYLGMARAELTDFGQRQPAHYVDVHVDDLLTSLTELERRLTALLEGSQTLQYALRADSARRLLRRGAAAVT